VCQAQADTEAGKCPAACPAGSPGVNGTQVHYFVT